VTFATRRVARVEGLLACSVSRAAKWALNAERIAAAAVRSEFAAANTPGSPTTYALTVPLGSCSKTIGCQHSSFRGKAAFHRCHKSSEHLGDGGAQDAKVARGSESRTLSFVGAFRVVPAGALRNSQDRPLDPRKSDLRHLKGGGPGAGHTGLLPRSRFAWAETNAPRRRPGGNLGESLGGGTAMGGRRGEAPQIWLETLP
jgi:hypothetical protein